MFDKLLTRLIIYKRYIYIMYNTHHIRDNTYFFGQKSLSHLLENI